MLEHTQRAIQINTQTQEKYICEKLERINETKEKQTADKSKRIGR